MYLLQPLVIWQGTRCACKVKDEIFTLTKPLDLPVTGLGKPDIHSGAIRGSIAANPVICVYVVNLTTLMKFSKVMK
jgi:hypothetical protein